MKYLKISFFILMPFLLSYCGDDQEFDVAIQVVPEESLLVPAKGTSCIDLAESVVDRTASIQPYSVLFSSFRLRWTSATEDLYVAEIRVSVAEADPNIGGFSFSVAGDELDLLLGVNGGRVPAATAGTTCDGGNITNCREILSDSNQTKPSPLVECGLRFGGVSVNDDDDRFISTAEVRIIGYSVNLNDNSQRPQRDIINIKIRKD